ncbi:tight adherence pilus pseudopilin TadF [Enterobacter sp.]|uniref:tight adherence pilus pseudopilin TadF n=1 Tax=Enterobacter sp. TaxID=42895 RepID=UPI00296E822D|nr:tight adherence pilus pseudopilin TadF [Enterobacter sp.]
MFLGKLKDENGSSSIEFAGYFFIFVLMSWFMIDMSSSVVRKGQLERVSNSLISILRERNVFYSGRINITNADLIQLNGIANVLLTNSDGTIQPHQLTIRAVTFAPQPIQFPQPPGTVITLSTDAIAGCNFRTDPTTPIAQLSALSSWGLPPVTTTRTGAAFWYPVYEITLCVAGAKSFFQQFIGGANQNMANLTIRNAAIPRL